MGKVLEKNKAINGLKGLACIVVACNHFSNLYGNDLPSVLEKLIINGGYMVIIFIGISIYFIAKSVLNNCVSDYGEFVLKRYLRLVLPIFLLCAIVFIGNMMGGFKYYGTAMSITGGGDPAVTYDNIFEFSDVIKASFFEVTFTSMNRYAFPLWMIFKIFLCGIATLIYTEIIKQKSFHQVCFFTIVSYLVIRQYLDGMYRIVPLIAFVAYVTNNVKKDARKEYLNVILFILGFLTNYVDYSSQEYIINYLYDFQMIGAACLIFSVVDSDLINKIIGNKVLDKIGDHSFEIYLTHQPITTSIMAWLCIKQCSIFGGYSWVVRIILWIEYLLIVFCTSIVWKKTFSSFCYTIQEKLILLYNKFKQL